MRHGAERPEHLIHVIQGDHATATDAGSVLTAVLGSCVAACLCDPDAMLGGMNHFLLPTARKNASDSTVYGAQAMELLINALLRQGARRDHLVAKLFGGARMIAGLSDIGRSNGEFARHYLRDEGIPCVAESLGGTRARRIWFWPTTGRARQILLGAAETVPVQPVRVARRVADVELF